MISLKRLGWSLIVLTVCGAVCAERAKPLSPEGRRKLAQFAREVLAGKVDKVSFWTAGKYPKELRDKRGEELFVTLIRDRAPIIRLGSQKRNLLESTLAAMVKARLMPSFDFYNFGDAHDTLLLFERVVERRTVPPARWIKNLSQIDLGVEGVAVTHGKRKGSLPPSAVFFDQLDDRDKFIGHLCRRIDVLPKMPRIRKANVVAWDPAKTRVERLGVETFLSRASDDHVVELHRMNVRRVAPVRDPLAAARRLGDKLTRSQHDDGRFLYVYDAVRGEYREGYTVIPHAYAVVTLCDLEKTVGAKRYGKAIGRGVGLLLGTLRTAKAETGEPFQYVVFDGKAKLGAAAMTVVALDRWAELTDSGRFDATMKQLGRFLLRMQYDDGSFRHCYDHDPGVKFRYKVSVAFPGQAVWALSTLHRRFGDKHWLDAAEKGADYLITRREKQMRWTAPPPDVWLAVGLQTLHERSKRNANLAYARRMADHALRQQLTGDAPVDLVGSFRGDREGSVRGAAARVRLFAETLRMQEDPGPLADAYLPAMKRSVAFIRRNFMRPDNAFYLAEPKRTYGLPRVTAFSNDIRLDTITHTIQALLSLARIEQRKAAP